MNDSPNVRDKKHKMTATRLKQSGGAMLRTSPKCKPCDKNKCNRVPVCLFKFRLTASLNWPIKRLS